MSLSTSAGFIKTEQDAINDTEALRLRSKGFTYQKIADFMGISKTAAYNRVQRALAAIPAELVDEYRKLENERLDLLLEKVLEKALAEDDNKGFLFAVDRALAIFERKGKLNGTDMPTKHEVVTIDYMDMEIKRLEALLGETDDNNSSAEVTEGQEV